MRAVSYILGSALALASVVSSTSILLPLYEWPTDNTTWSPVFEAATAHPHINFKVIVNPDTGPGDTGKRTQINLGILKIKLGENQ